jgi:hypothetical protein
MVGKKWFLTAAVLGAVLATAAAYHVSRETPPRQPSCGEAQANAATGIHPAVKLEQVAGARLGFGPVIEATLPAAKSGGHTEILNLETGRWLTEPRLDQFNDDARALVIWFRTNGVNISSFVWPDGAAACQTYNMTVVPLDTKCWEESAAEAVCGIPRSAADRHSPRRLLFLASGQPDTYVFQTDQGTLGILRLVGLSDDRHGVKIRYKLVQSGSTCAVLEDDPFVQQPIHP